MAMRGNLVAPFSWKRLCFLLVALSAVQSVFLYMQSNDGTHSRIFDFSPHYSSRTWAAKITSPTDGLGTLTTEQCNGVFPDLYHEVDRAVASWKNRGHTISEQDTTISWRDDAAFRILIHDNKLRILQTKAVSTNRGYRERALSVMSLIQQALWSASAAGELLPTIEAAVVVDDMSLLGGDPAIDTRSIWTFTSNVHDENHKRHWLIPDFSLYSARATGSFEDMRQRAQQYDSPFADKIPKAVWRGVTWTNEALRGALLNMTEGQSWADVAVVNWEAGENIIAMDEHCRYAFTVHTEGRSYSGRLPFLLNCDAVPFIHHPWDWTTHLHHLLIKKGKNQNYVSVRRDFGDLERGVKYYLGQPREARRIIRNSIDTFRSKYTTSTATSCYLRRLIAGYSTVSFAPNATRPTTNNIALNRGISFEDYIHFEEDYPGDDPSSSTAE